MMREFNAKDANFLWRQIGRIDGVMETLDRTEGEMPEIIAGVLKRMVKEKGLTIEESSI